MQLNHMTMETSHGLPRPPGAPKFDVRCAMRCSASLSNSIVNATNACDSKLCSGFDWQDKVRMFLEILTLAMAELFVADKRFALIFQMQHGAPGASAIRVL